MPLVHYSGGLKLRIPQTYGQYELRVRVQDDPSEVTSGVVLLWPESNEWPEDFEVDFWETFDDRDTRTPVRSFVHRLNPAATPPYTAADDEVVATTIHTGIDQSDWHKIVCSWEPDALTIEIDNGAPVLLTGDPSHIPDWPMELALQLDAWSHTPPAAPVEMDVDYIIVRPRTGPGTFGAPVYFNQFDSTALGVEWEIYDSPGNAGFGLRRPSQVAVVAEPTATSGTNVVRITAEALEAPAGYRVENGRLLRPDGDELIAAGLNGPVAIGTGAAFTLDPDVALAWAYEAYPAGSSFHLINDIWTGPEKLVAGHQVFPGGTVSPGRYWNHAAIVDPTGLPLTDFVVTLPDRGYAMNGQRSAAAIAFGIPEPSDHWHCDIYRINAHLRSGPLTWNVATPLGLTADVLVPQYVARTRELVDLGILAAPEFHDMTAVVGRPDYEVTPELLADPLLPVAALPDGYLRDSLVFYDAMAAEFTGAEIIMALLNEFNQAGRSTAYDDVIVTLIRRIRGRGWTGVVTVPLPRWCGDLGVLARGELDTLVDRLESHGVADGLVFEWHNWGDYYPGGGAPQRPITYADIDADLAACRNGVPGSGRRYAVWMAEYGRPVPAGFPGTLPNAPLGVATMATTTLGPQRLAEKYPHICPTSWAVGDNSFNARYALTRGVVNKLDENAGDPNTVGDPGSLGPNNPGVFPWWSVTSEALADEWLTAAGRAHWDLAHTITAIPPAPPPPPERTGTAWTTRGLARLARGSLDLAGLQVALLASIPDDVAPINTDADLAPWELTTAEVSNYARQTISGARQASDTAAAAALTAEPVWFGDLAVPATPSTTIAGIAVIDWHTGDVLWIAELDPPQPPTGAPWWLTWPPATPTSTSRGDAAYVVNQTGALDL